VASKHRRTRSVIVESMNTMTLIPTTTTTTTDITMTADEMAILAMLDAPDIGRYRRAIEWARFAGRLRERGHAVSIGRPL